MEVGKAIEATCGRMRIGRRIVWDGEVDDRLWGMMRTTLLVTMALAIVLPAFAQQVGPAPLFASEEAIELTLTADFSLLKDDRRA